MCADLHAVIDGFAAGSPDWGIHLYADRGDQPAFYGYPTLHAMIHNAAANYRERGLAVGTRVLVPLETSIESVVAFLALVRAGALVFCVKPASGSPAAYGEFLDRIARAHGCRWLLETPSNREVPSDLERLPLIKPDAAPHGVLPPEPVSPQAIAFVQFSSGSTSFPKGVPIEHGNLVRQLELLTSFDGRAPGQPGASWLPLFHDMGLIGGLLSALYAQLDLHLCSPRRFLADPLDWLHVVSQRRVQRFATPNFGIQYLLRAIRNADAEELASLNFSALRHIFVGAEPIHAGSLQEFAGFLREHGMRENAVQPAYGMAEAVLIATGGKDTAPRVVKGNNGVPCVSVGRPLPGFEMSIRVSDGREAKEREPGEILLRGGTLAREYFENPTQLLDEQQFYRTGDIGFWDRGELFVMGRSGDRLKLNGESYFAHDFERVIERLPGLRARSCVVLQQGAELWALIEKPKSSDYEELRCAVQNTVLENIGVKIPLAHIAWIRPGQIRRTSSGKLQRLEMLNAWAQGEIQLSPIHANSSAPHPGGREQPRESAAESVAG